MAASTSWRLAGSKYFNPRSRGSVTQWRHVLMGLVGLATEVYIYIGRAEARCPRTYPVRMWLANTRRGGISGKHREHLYIIPIFIDICYGTYGTRHASSDKISLLSRRWLPRWWRDRKREEGRERKDKVNLEGEEDISITTKSKLFFWISHQSDNICRLKKILPESLSDIFPRRGNRRELSRVGKEKSRIEDEREGRRKELGLGFLARWKEGRKEGRKGGRSKWIQCPRGAKGEHPCKTPGNRIARDYDYPCREKRVIYPVAVLITAPGHIIQPAATPYWPFRA